MGKDIKPKSKTEERVEKAVEKPVAKPEPKVEVVGTATVECIAGFYDVKADKLRHVGEEFNCDSSRAKELAAKGLVK